MGVCKGAMEHGWLWYILVGFLAGALAKALMPGERSEPQGCLLTILLGIAGSLVTGFLMQTLLSSQGSGALIPSIFGATIGACILIWIARKLSK